MSYLSELAYKPFDFQEIVGEYENWVAKEGVLVFHKHKASNARVEKFTNKKVDPFSQLIARPAAKRGNQVYVERVQRRIEQKTGHIPDFEIYDTRERATHSTDVLFITLTYGERERLSLSERWESVGNDFRIFMDNMRKHYGDIEFIRSWESHQDGYPHIHLVARFRKKSFVAVSMWSKGKRQQRIVGEDFQKIKAYWTHGHSDILAVASYSEVGAYIVKYVTKAASDGKHILTLAMLWYFRKQSYSISKRFFEDCKPARPNALFSTLHNSDYFFEFVAFMTKTEFEIYRQEHLTRVELERTRLRGPNLSLNTWGAIR